MIKIPQVLFKVEYNEPLPGVVNFVLYFEYTQEPNAFFFFVNGANTLKFLIALRLLIYPS